MLTPLGALEPRVSLRRPPSRDEGAIPAPSLSAIAGAPSAGAAALAPPNRDTRERRAGSCSSDAPATVALGGAEAETKGVSPPAPPPRLRSVLSGGRRRGPAWVEVRLSPQTFARSAALAVRRLCRSSSGGGRRARISDFRCTEASSTRGTVPCAAPEATLHDQLRREGASGAFWAGSNKAALPSPSPLPPPPSPAWRADGGDAPAEGWYAAQADAPAPPPLPLPPWTRCSQPGPTWTSSRCHLTGGLPHEHA